MIILGTAGCAGFIFFFDLRRKADWKQREDGCPLFVWNSRGTQLGNHMSCAPTLPEEGWW